MQEGEPLLRKLGVYLVIYLNHLLNDFLIMVSSKEELLKARAIKTLYLRTMKREFILNLQELLAVELAMKTFTKEWKPSSIHI